MPMMWLLWGEDYKMLKKCLWHWLNKQDGNRNKWEKKTKFVIESQKPYNENEYIKLDRCNFEIVKDYTNHGTILTKMNEFRD
jgi:hypothetical protein